MSEVQLSIIFLVALFMFLSLGVWVALALTGAGIVGMMVFTPRPVGDAMMISFWSASSGWALTALPLFILMGEILFRTRLSEDLLKGLAPWLRRIPGGLLHTNILGSTLFAAVSGSSAATLLTVGKMSLPELQKQGYPRKLALGTLAGASTLGLMIPPSLTLIVYGATVNESINKLFLAGVFPGLLLASLFMGYVIIWSKLNKDKVPVDNNKISFGEKLKNSSRLLPLIAVILMIMISLYGGWATATESASLGVVGALLIAWREKALNWKNLSAGFMSAARTSSMIILILVGASFLSLTMGYTGIPRKVAEMISAWQVSNFELILILMVFYLIIGCFLDGISTIVLTLPVLEHTIRMAGFDLIWFGIFVVVIVEVAQITPPVGFNLFVMKGLTKEGIGTIARASLPMFLIMIAMVFILYAFPEIATFLPEQQMESR